MEMFLMAAVMSVLATVVSAALFAAATRDARPASSSPAERAAQEPRRFFADAPPATASSASPDAPQVPVEALLLQIEKHIRLEQAVAESFLDTPSGESLHSRTTSRLAN